MSKEWAQYATYPSYVLGFHGCDESVGEGILSGKNVHLTKSENDYDWLGHGIYFWEANPSRAEEFATERANGRPVSKGSVTKPFVLGAIIDLGRCLNLLDSGAFLELKDAYSMLKTVQGAVPTNGKAKLMRRLDCAVIETLHAVRGLFHETDDSHPPYQTVRGVFQEGDEVYPDAGFNDKDHIQLCVRDTSCIKGYFRPIKVR